MIILVPAYEPGDSLVRIVRELRDDSPWSIVLVVDDGSGPAYAPVFDAARAQGAEVIGYNRNRGKGYALRTGFRHVLAHYPDEAVVTADSDGQHRVVDIVRVAERVSAQVDGPPAIVLGGRRFAGEVPLRSRFGNSVSRVAFRLAAGLRIGDTQTGLRGFSAGTLPWALTVGGDRFEYETRMLLATREAGIGIEEIEIDTVYLEHNASSHFRPVVDSIRVMRPLLTFAAVSLGSFLLDLVLRIAVVLCRECAGGERNSQLSREPPRGLCALDGEHSPAGGPLRRACPCPACRQLRSHCPADRGRCAVARGEGDDGCHPVHRELPCTATLRLREGEACVGCNRAGCRHAEPHSRRQ